LSAAASRRRARDLPPTRVARPAA